MTTQAEIAKHLDLNQKTVSELMASLEIDWRTTPLDDIRLAYIRRLRASASGRSLEAELTMERIQTERITRESKTLDLAEKRGNLVNVAQLEAELQQMFTAYRVEMLARDDKLKSDLDTLYGIEVDIQIINRTTHDALSHLARYDPGGAGTGASAGSAGDAAGEDDHDDVGADLPPPVA